MFCGRMTSESGGQSEQLAKAVLLRRLGILASFALWAGLSVAIELLLPRALRLVSLVVGVSGLAVIAMVLSTELRALPCPQCGKPLFFPMRWSNVDIFWEHTCVHCRLSFSVDLLIRRQSR